MKTNYKLGEIYGKRVKDLRWARFMRGSSRRASRRSQSFKGILKGGTIKDSIARGGKTKEIANRPS